MNSDLPSSAICYGLYDDDTIVGFFGILHQPHPVNTKIKRGSRLVILPDYQGIGLGRKFADFVADMYRAQGYDFEITTSSKTMIRSLKRDGGWVLTRYGIPSYGGKTAKIDSRKVRKLRTECKTATFFKR